MQNIQIRFSLLTLVLKKRNDYRLLGKRKEKGRFKAFQCGEEKKTEIKVRMTEYEKDESHGKKDCRNQLKRTETITVALKSR